MEGSFAFEGNPKETPEEGIEYKDECVSSDLFVCLIESRSQASCSPASIWVTK